MSGCIYPPFVSSDDKIVREMLSTIAFEEIFNGPCNLDVEGSDMSWFSTVDADSAGQQTNK